MTEEKQKTKLKPENEEVTSKQDINKENMNCNLHKIESKLRN